MTINGYSYRLLILPRATVVPVATMRAIRDFAKAGGTVVALDELPSAAAGLQEGEANDRELKQLVSGLFGTDSAGQAGAVFLPEYKVARTPFSPARQPYAATAPLTDPQRQLLAALNRVAAPDFTLAGRAQSDGFETLVTNMNTLASWTDAERTRHFSGTDRYEIEFDLPAARLVKGARMTLDLGKVGNIAEVELNGQAVGVAWTAPHRLDITRAARAGKNKLVVLVTDTLINYVTGLKAPHETYNN